MKNLRARTWSRINAHPVFSLGIATALLAVGSIGWTFLVNTAEPAESLPHVFVSLTVGLVFTIPGIALAIVSYIDAVKAIRAKF